MKIAMPALLSKRKTESDTARKETFFQKYGHLVLCMILPAALIYFMYLAREIYPFGNGSVLVLDLNGQYVWFFEALRNFAHGDTSLLYSFSRALGGEFLGIYAYYLASPLSYIVCLFPQDRMLEGLFTLFLIKGAICGGTFGFYMHKTMKEFKPFSIVIFSTFYALSSYAIVQQHNTMWIDAVMWLPLITLGIEELIRHGKYKLYTVFLALTLFSNFYIGYMVCIYCLIYFFLFYAAHPADELNPDGEKRHFLRSLIRIALYSLLAVGIAAVILLGAYYSLNFGKSTFSTPKWDWKLKFDILDLLYKFLPGSYDTVRPAGYPFVYCGLLTLLLLPAYFLSPKYSMRQKITSAVFVLIFVASFSFSVLDLIWHGFQTPNWLNYRQSFMLCFYLCVLGCRAFADFDHISLRGVMTTGGLIALLCVFLQKYTNDAYVNPDDYTCIWFSLLLIGVYLAVLAIMRKANDKQAISIALLAVVCAEAFLNGLWNMNALDDDVVYTGYHTYNDFLKKTRPIVEQVQEMDDSFYRMEKTFSRKTNDNMALEIRGLSGSTSTLNKETIQFLNKMGYSSKSHWSKYLGGNPVSDSLLGLKYIIDDKNLYDYCYEPVATDDVNHYIAYKNPYALSIAYGVSGDLLDFPLGYTNTQPDTSGSGKIAQLIASVKSAINRTLDIDETVNTSEYVDEYSSPFERLNAIITAMLGDGDATDEVFRPIDVAKVGIDNLTKKFYQGGEHGYVKTESSKDGVLTYTIDVPVTGELFFYLPTKYPQEVKLTLVGADKKSTDMGTFNGNETARIISLGMQEAGTTVSLKMKMTTEHFYILTGADCFYYIDWTTFEDVMERLAKDQFIIEDFDEKSFDGTFTASEEHELVLTTIAYDKGWKVTVDGKPVETVKALGSLVAFYVDGDAGQTHEIGLVYSPGTFRVGIVISAVSLLLFLLIVILEKFLRKTPVLRGIVMTLPEEKHISVYDLAEAREAEEAKQKEEDSAENSESPGGEPAPDEPYVPTDLPDETPEEKE